MAELINLDNGLRIIIDKRELPTAAIAVAVDMGSAYEDKSKRGISHVIEHVIYRAYPNIDLVIEGLGGMSDAYTERTMTMYLFEVIPDNVMEVLKIIANMFSRRKISDDDLNKELRVILSELNMRNDDPGTLIYDLGPRALFGDSDYGDPIIGFEETVKSITKEDVEEYLNRFYMPDNMIMAIVGPVSIDIGKLKELFNKWSGKASNKKRPSYTSGKPIILRQNINSAYISYSWYINVNDTFNTLIKSTLLEFHLVMGLSSYLVSRFRNKGLSYAIDMDREYLDGVILFQIVISAIDPKDLEMVKEELEKSLCSITEITKDKDYLAHRRNYLKYVINDYMRRPLNIAESEAFIGLKFNNYDIDLLNRSLEENFTVNLSDIVRSGVWSMILPG